MRQGTAIDVLKLTAQRDTVGDTRDLNAGGAPTLPARRRSMDRLDYFARARTASEEDDDMKRMFRKTVGLLLAAGLGSAGLAAPAGAEGEACREWWGSRSMRPART